MLKQYHVCMYILLGKVLKRYWKLQLNVVGWMDGCPLGCYGYKRTGGANEINVQMMVYNLDTKPFWRSEVDEIEKVDDISKQLPWFLECNPDRYPYWWAFLRF